MPFAPGQSGNPSGRPRGFAGVAKHIMRETRDGDELVEFALTMMRDAKARPAERLAAHAWLSDRALGRPLATIDATLTNGNAPSYDFNKLSIEERRELLEKLRALRGDGAETDELDEDRQ